MIAVFYPTWIFILNRRIAIGWRDCSETIGNTKFIFCATINNWSGSSNSSEYNGFESEHIYATGSFQWIERGESYHGKTISDEWRKWKQRTNIDKRQSSTDRKKRRKKKERLVEILFFLCRCSVRCSFVFLSSSRRVLFHFSTLFQFIQLKQNHLKHWHICQRLENCFEEFFFFSHSLQISIPM